MSILHLGKCVLVSRPDICFVSMECTLHGAVKLNMITGFSKAVDNLLVIKNPSRCAVCLRWSLLLPEHKNSVNTNPGHRRMFQTVDTHRPGPGPLQLLFISSGLTALILHNVGGFGCGFFSSWNGFWYPYIEDYLALSKVMVCLQLWLAVCFLTGFSTCADWKTCLWVLSFPSLVLWETHPFM